MGILDFLFGRQKSNEPDVKPLADWSTSRQPVQNKRMLEIPGDGLFEYDIVGEGAYQKNLLLIAGPKEEQSKWVERTAKLIPEPENKHDENAIKVEISGRTVGYIARSDTAAFHRVMRSKGAPGGFIVSAVIVGGWLNGDDEGHFGVKLDLPSID